MTDAASPKGLGGWLILMILGFVIGPIRIVNFLATTYWPIFRDGTWSELTTVGAAGYHHLWAPLLTFEIIGNVCSVILQVVTLVFLFNKSRYTPRLAIASLAWNAGFILVDFFVADLVPAVAAQSNPDSFNALFQSIIGAAIWIPYFLMSERVRATFVE